MVPELGIYRGMSRWLKLPNRFPGEPSPEEATRQWNDREKWLVRCAFTPPTDTSEEGYEDWFDEVARTVESHGLSTEVFTYLCGHALGTSDARLWRRIGREEDHEAVIARFLHARFPASELAYQLEKGLYAPPRAADVYSAQECLQASLSRYVRACERQQRLVFLTDKRAEEIAMRMLPADVEEHMYTYEAEATTWNDVQDYYEHAAKVEAKLQKKKNTARVQRQLELLYEQYHEEVKELGEKRHIADKSARDAQTKLTVC
eukprot:GHVS01069947.1.p1 GENE.GHVS01069947.1~~GHVS01069947.1.p1  ORF type:complete len:261 (+),score=20.04 GHVS01069947.1:164-946(+)